MQPDALEALVLRFENASTADPEAIRDLLSGLNDALADTVGPVDASVLTSTEAALHAVDRALPGWRIAMERGRRWRCTLRESAARDDDELIGVATAPTPPLALMGALLAVVARRARGYL